MAVRDIFINSIIDSKKFINPTYNHSLRNLHNLGSTISFHTHQNPMKGPVAQFGRASAF